MSLFFDIEELFTAKLTSEIDILYFGLAFAKLAWIQGLSLPSCVLVALSSLTELSGESNCSRW